MRLLVSGKDLHGVPCGLPGLQAAIEYGDGVMTEPFQHPPQAAAIIAAVAVIDNGLHGIVKPPLAQSGGKVLGQGQGMAAAACRVSGPVAAEIVVQVSMACAGNVCLRKLPAACCRIGQVIAAIKHHQGPVFLLQGMELIDGNQGVVTHGDWGRG